MATRHTADKLAILIGKIKALRPEIIKQRRRLDDAINELSTILLDLEWTVHDEVIQYDSTIDS